MNIVFKGDILSVRVIEDCIRITRKYTKGAFTRSTRTPIQGEEFPSKVVTEYYEVYPDTKLDWNMPATEAWALVWGDVTHIDILFQYDYRANANKAKMTILGGPRALAELNRGIPGLSKALEGVAQDNADEKPSSKVVDRDNRVGSCPNSHP